MRFRHVSDTMADLRFALRQFRRRPFVTTAMAAVLAIGLGVSASVFVLVTSFTNAPLAGGDAGADAVRIRGIDRSRGPGRATGREFSYAEVQEYAARAEVFRDVGAWTSSDVVLDLGRDTPDLQSGAATFVTPHYFGVLGIPAPAGAVISHTIWERFYGRSDAVIGRTLKVNNTVVTIAGVAPEGFVGARAGGSKMRVWLPLDSRLAVLPAAPRLAIDAPVFGIVARLAPGASPESATAVAATIAGRFAEKRDAGRPLALDADVVPLLATNYFPPSGEPSSGAGPLQSLLMPLLILLITCTSVSALLAGQALARRREIAVRLAMGAGRRRIVRQLLTETALLGLVAAALAFLVLRWTLAGVELSIVGTGAAIVVDWRSGIFVAGLALVASVAFGLSPALHATRATVSDVLKEHDEARGRTRLQTTLVIAQIALTQPALLIMGALLLELRGELRDQPATANAERILEIGFNTNERYGAIDGRREETIERVRARIAGLPGVAGAVTQQIGGNGSERVASHPDDRAGNQTGVLADAVALRAAPDGYFEAMGLELVRGRTFGSDERRASGIVIVNSELAKRLWGDAPPVGRRLLIADGDPDPLLGRAVTVVGVVNEAGEPRMYQPQGREPTSHLIVRTHGAADEALPAIRRAALAEAPDAPVTFARSLASVEREARRGLIMGVAAAGGAAAVALTLAAVGLYAVVAVAVGQRRREIGVRAALGADRRRLAALFMKRGLRVSALGSAIGIGASLFLMKVLPAVGGRPLGSGLAGLLVGVAMFVVAVAVVATWIPARRAATIDPLSVLRAD
jgi:putative ABC transport system permease protein